jgi:hypothetical protein
VPIVARQDHAQGRSVLALLLGARPAQYAGASTKLLGLGGAGDWEEPLLRKEGPKKVGLREIDQVYVRICIQHRPSHGNPYAELLV